MNITYRAIADESIKPLVGYNKTLAPALNHINTKLRVNFDGSCLKQEKVTFTHKNVVKIYIVYGMNLWPYTQRADFMLENFLFGAVEFTKNTDPVFLFREWCWI